MLIIRIKISWNYTDHTMNIWITELINSILNLIEVIHRPRETKKKNLRWNTIYNFVSLDLSHHIADSLQDANELIRIGETNR